MADVTLSGSESTLWIGAIGLFGVGDLVTTLIGFSTGKVTEENSFASQIYQDFGAEGLILYKAAILAAALFVSLQFPSPYRLGVPIALIVVGAGAVWNNLRVLSQVSQAADTWARPALPAMLDTPAESA